MSEQTTEAVESTDEVKKKTRRGATPFVITRAARNHERALRALQKLTKSQKGVKAALARLEAAQEAYDAAVEEAKVDPEELAEAQRAVDETKAALDAAMRGEVPENNEE